MSIKPFNWLALVVSFFCASVFLGINSKAYADTNNFVINNFDAKYVISNTDYQGTLKVVESIDLTFSDNNHGILRAIPNTYKDNSLDISDITVTSSTGAPSQFSESSSNGNTVLKIGDPNRTVTGKQNYTVSYTVSNVITFYDMHDEFYWDINGTEWLQSFEKVSMSLTLPTSVSLSTQNQSLCYTGVFGSTEKNCEITYNKETNTIISRTLGTLQAGQSLTAIVGFEKGYFTPVSIKEKLSGVAIILAETFGIPLLLGGIAFSHWRTKGRDPKGRGVIIPQYEPPKGLLPAEVGAIVDFKVDQKDITATIIDLAIRGYIQIIETKVDKKIFKDTVNYTFKLTKFSTSGLSDYETTILVGIFGDITTGPERTVELKDLEKTYYTTVSTSKKEIKNRLVTEGYFRGDPAKSGAILWAIVGISFAMLVTCAAIFGPGVVIGLLLSMPIVTAFAYAMPARTALGVEVKEYALGLKLY
ncbi:DUF2207 domain-containing protein, partial [bacterium]|nr:DUF2207 domain-containing protein [bacterium]